MHNEKLEVADKECNKNPRVAQMKKGKWYNPTFYVDVPIHQEKKFKNTKKFDFQCVAKLIATQKFFRIKAAWTVLTNEQLVLIKP